MEIPYHQGKLSPTVSKLLSDKIYEKRKAGALMIEGAVRDLIKAKQQSSISALVKLLSTEFTFSIVPNSRNGGLIALAAAAIALGPLVHLHLEEIVSPILACFSDQDSRVRYYACESMYNVGKVARGNILVWFNEIFDALTKLSVDVEASVKNGAELLDRLIKDIISEKSAFYHPAIQAAVFKAEDEIPQLQLQSQMQKSVPGTVDHPGGPYTFNLPRFIPLLIERYQELGLTLSSFRIHVISAPGRLFLIQWVMLLNSIPDLELVLYLPEFLEGLFVFLADRHVDVRTATLDVLSDFLMEITNVVKVQKERGSVDLVHVPKENQHGADADPTSSLKAEGVKLIESRPYIQGQATILDFSRMTKTLSQFISSTDQETQATALRWINTFLVLAEKDMIKDTAMILGNVLPALAHSVPAIKALAIDANTNLFNLVVGWDGSAATVLKESAGDGDEPRTKDYPFDVFESVTTLMQKCQDEQEETRIGALEWLVMLHKKYPKEVMNSDHTLFQGLLKTLTDFSEEVVRRDLQLMAQISHSSDDAYFTKFISNLVALFTADRRLLETRGGLIVRQLCLYLNPERMYYSFGEILEQEPDLEFASTMVQTLNLILLTCPELTEMRHRLKNIETKDGFALFSSLYRSWCHNPISCFTLCLLCQAYEHAANLMTLFGELEITVNFLIQTDKLVQLLESPVFTPLRLQLLEPDKYPYLYKSLYGILMLLPQSSAFATLRNRLNCLGNLAVLHIPTNAASKKPKEKDKMGAVGDGQSITVSKWNEFLTHFKIIQTRHEKARRIANEKERQWPAGRYRPATSSSKPTSSGGQSSAGRDSKASIYAGKPPTSAFSGGNTKK